MTVGRVVLQYGLVTPTSPDSIGVRDPETPYVVASVTVDGALPREAFALRVGERSVAPTTVDRLSGLVPAGERVTIPVSDRWAGRPPADRVGDGDPDVTYHLGYAGRVDSAEIRVVESDSS